jgi:hypothetical protein
MGRVVGSWKTAGLVGGRKTLSVSGTGITSSDGVGDAIARREMDRGPLGRLIRDQSSSTKLPSSCPPTSLIDVPPRNRL